MLYCTEHGQKKVFKRILLTEDPERRRREMLGFI
jgi:hypothetical protein